MPKKAFLWRFVVIRRHQHHRIDAEPRQYSGARHSRVRSVETRTDDDFDLVSTACHRPARKLFDFGSGERRRFAGSAGYDNSVAALADVKIQQSIPRWPIHRPIGRRWGDDVNHAAVKHQKAPLDISLPSVSNS